MKSIDNQIALFLLSSWKHSWVGFSRIKRLLIVVVILFGDNVTVLCQHRTINGLVTSTDGTAIPGVNVVVKGTMIGTVTDLNGRYTLVFESGGSILSYSFIGYQTMEVTIGDQTIIDLHMTPDITLLQEIVVTGYSTINKKDISSSISVVDVDDMRKIAGSNIGDQLQGKVAGVQISTSGEPGSFQYVRIRGIGTINNNEPLYVIDGVPVQNETDMNFLNPNDIESMQVLKDASAAIYGARAANGVIVITTKKGTGKPKINFDFFYGSQTPQHLPELANPTERLAIDKAKGTLNGNLYVQNPTDGTWELPDYFVTNRVYASGDPAVDPSKYVLNTTDPSLFSQNYPIALANKAGTNWFEELYKPASSINAQISVSGGTDKGTHFFSMNFYDYHGTLIGNKWQRIQARLNNTFLVGKNVRVGENLNLSFENRTGADLAINTALGSVANIYNYSNIVPVYDTHGYYATNNPQTPNPVAAQIRSANGGKSNGFRLTGNAFFELDFLTHFTFKSNFGIDYYQNPTTAFTYLCPECASSGQQNSLTKSWSAKRNIVLTGTINYSREINKHTLGALVGAEARSAAAESFYASGRGLQFDDLSYRELVNAEAKSFTAGSNSSNNKMVSAFANLNYTYDGKYIFGAIVRSDGSSRFVNHKYQTFYGASAAWRITQEPFLSDIQNLSSLKLRASYGSTGNNEVAGGDYPGFTTYGTSPQFSSYSINGAPNQFVRGFALTSPGNPNLRWETSSMANIAIDATIFKSFDITAEIYSRKTHNMIYAVQQPLETGYYLSLNKNVGSVLNKGLDLQATYRGTTNSQKFSYTIGVTGTHFSNKVLALNDSASFIWDNPRYQISRTQPGYPIGQFYGFVAEGLWQSKEQIDAVLTGDPGGIISQAKPGRMKFKDINGDGVIKDDDRTFIGNPIPKFILGLNLTLNYKNIDFTAYFYGVFGRKIFNAYKEEIDNKKRVEEAGITLPIFEVDDSPSYRHSSYSVEDGSFLRFRNLVVGYSFRGNALSKIGLTKARIYLQSQNIFTWTKYSGMDPDVSVINMRDGNAVQRDLGVGIDVSTYPWSRQFIAGINLQF